MDPAALDCKTGILMQLGELVQGIRDTDSVCTSVAVIHMVQKEIDHLSSLIPLEQTESAHSSGSGLARRNALRVKGGGRS